MYFDILSFISVGRGKQKLTKIWHQNTNASHHVHTEQLNSNFPMQDKMISLKTWTEENPATHQADTS